MGDEPAEGPKSYAKNYGLLRDVGQLAKMANDLLRAGVPVGFDLETGYHGPDHEDRALDIAHPDQFVCGFSISGGEEWARYIPLHHEFSNNMPHPELAWEAIGPLLTKGHIVSHNAKFEIKNVLKAAGYLIGGDGGTVEDTMLDAYVLSEFGLKAKGVFGLKDLVYILFGYAQPHIETLFPGQTDKQMKALRFNVLQLTPEVMNYCCDDAAWALALRNKYSRRAMTERKDMREIEHRIMQIMVDVENLGVAVDWEGLAVAKAQSDKFLPIIDKAAMQGLEDMAGRSLLGLKVNSPLQMRRLLYEELGMSTTRKTKTGALSTDATALEGLSQKHPQIKKLLEVREVMNLNARISTWLEDYQQSWDHRVHASYNQVRVGTGRFAAEDPAIQQLPKDWRWSPLLGVDAHKDKKAWEDLISQGVNGVDYWGGNFRDFVVAGPGSYFLTYDYSQIELRWLAGVTQEPELLRAFANDEDVHTLTAALMLGKKVEDIDYDVDRPVGKTMNFALLYQMGPESLAERLGITLERAKQLYAQYFAAFSRIASWQHRITAQGKRLGYAETKFGRKYTVWELQADRSTKGGRGTYSKGERVLTNAPIQGGAADYMKLAMIRAADTLKAKGWWMSKCTIVANLHDALTFEVSNELDPAEVRALLEPRVVFPVAGFPKIVADWELGQRWGSSVKWKAGMTPWFDGEHWKLKKPEDKPEIVQAAQVEEVAVEVSPAPQLSLVSQPELPHRTCGRVTVEIAENPSTERLRDFVEFVKSRPGEKEVWLKCPKGDLKCGRSSMSIADQGRVILLLGGASVSEELSDEELESLAANLSA